MNLMHYCQVKAKWPSLNEHFTIVEIDNIIGKLSHHEAKYNLGMPNSVEHVIPFSC